MDVCELRDDLLEGLYESGADAVLIDGTVDQLLLKLADLPPDTKEDVHRILNAVQVAAQRVHRTLRELAGRL